MKRIALGLLAVIALSLPVMAEVSDDSVVLTPGTLYEMVEQVKKRADGISARGEALRKRVELIEGFLGDADTAGSFAHYVKVQDYKITELERKVEGMQKQITVLHSIKVNKASCECEKKAKSVK